MPNRCGKLASAAASAAIALVALSVTPAHAQSLLSTLINRCSYGDMRACQLATQLSAQQRAAREGIGGSSAVPAPTGPVGNTMALVNRMMHDALHGDAAEIERRYHGMNSLNAGIAAQNKVYNDVQKHDQAVRDREARMRERAWDEDAAQRQRRAEWDLWEAQE
jgi:hypothetical protein